MNIDLIKRAVEDADGFEIDEYNDVSVKEANQGGSLNTGVFNHLLYPHLLTKAIDGINKNHESLTITQYSHGIDVDDQETKIHEEFYFDEEGPDVTYDDLRVDCLEYVYREMIK